jgi:hypothetical protein
MPRDSERDETFDGWPVIAKLMHRKVMMRTRDNGRKQAEIAKAMKLDEEAAFDIMRESIAGSERCRP